MGPVRRCCILAPHRVLLKAQLTADQTCVGITAGSADPTTTAAAAISTVRHHLLAVVCGVHRTVGVRAAVGQFFSVHSNSLIFIPVAVMLLWWTVAIVCRTAIFPTTCFPARRPSTGLVVVLVVGSCRVVTNITRCARSGPGTPTKSVQALFEDQIVLGLAI